MFCPYKVNRFILSPSDGSFLGRFQKTNYTSFITFNAFMSVSFYQHGTAKRVNLIQKKN